MFGHWLPCLAAPALHSLIQTDRWRTLIANSDFVAKQQSHLGFMKHAHVRPYGQGGNYSDHVQCHLDSMPRAQASSTRSSAVDALNKAMGAT